MMQGGTAQVMDAFVSLYVAGLKPNIISNNTIQTLLTLTIEGFSVGIDKNFKQK